MCIDDSHSLLPVRLYTYIRVLNPVMLNLGSLALAVGAVLNARVAALENGVGRLPCAYAPSCGASTDRASISDSYYMQLWDTIVSTHISCRSPRLTVRDAAWNAYHVSANASQYHFWLIDYLLQCEINETVVLETAQFMKSLGFLV